MPRARGLLVPSLVLAMTAILSAQERKPDSAPTPSAVGAGSESRPALLLWVDGGPDEATIWRGWPVIVRVQTLAGGPPSEVRLRGPANGTVTRVQDLWLVPADQSARLVPGDYTLTAGGVEVQVRVAAPPGELTPTQKAILWRLRVQVALATQDLQEAQRAADEWTQAESSSYLAHLAKGDVRRALGDARGALEAYDQALRRAPRGVRPSTAVHARIREQLAATAASLPKLPGTAPSADEARYYELIAVGDSALAAGNRDAAARGYADAEAFRRDRKLAISPIELEAKRAALRSPASRPGPDSKPRSEAARGVGPKGVVVPASELSDATIRADAHGQWAASARAGSEYGSSTYSAARLVGAPDVPGPGDHGNAWCHHSSAHGLEWIELTYANPVHATEVRVRQNSTPGTIVKVEAIDPDGNVHLWWEGVDPFKAPAQSTLAWFAVRVPKTDYLVAKVRITLNLAAIAGWKEIDAVQLVGSNQ